MIGDRDLSAFRQDYYALLVPLFWREPPGELLRRLGDGIEERIPASRKLHALLGEGWELLNHFLMETPSEQWSEAVADEYVRLFIGPHGPTVTPYESYYLTGHLLDRPLAKLRADLKIIGIEKSEEHAEPEDFLALELEVMRWLIGKQTASVQDDEHSWLQRQADFLKNHLLIWAPACARDMEAAQGTRFYRGAAKILRGFLELETTFFPDGALDKIASLDEVRRIYGAAPVWKGPTFDFS